jgi:competence protein ComEA
MSRAAGRSLWGWSDRAHRLLAGSSVVLALALGWTSRPGPGPARSHTRLVIDPNTAPPAVLNALPRLGPVLVGRIVEERERRPFDSLADLDQRVRGIGPATVAAIGPYLRFRSDPPHDAATASLASRPRATRHP